jgi:hypothetical protein
VRRARPRAVARERMDVVPPSRVSRRPPS